MPLSGCYETYGRPHRTYYRTTIVRPDTYFRPRTHHPQIRHSVPRPRYQAPRHFRQGRPFRNSPYGEFRRHSRPRGHQGDRGRRR